MAKKNDFSELREKYKNWIEDYFPKVLSKAQKLLANHFPEVNVPENKHWELVNDLGFEFINDNITSCVYFTNGKDKVGYLSTHNFVRTPRDILRLVRRLQAIEAWFDARLEGQKREAEEIMRQQRKFVDRLKAEFVLNKV